MSESAKLRLFQHCGASRNLAKIFQLNEKMGTALNFLVGLAHLDHCIVLKPKNLVGEGVHSERCCKLKFHWCERFIAFIFP